MGNHRWRWGATALGVVAVLAACSGGSTTNIVQFFGDDGGDDSSPADAGGSPFDASVQDTSTSDAGGVAISHTDGGDAGADGGDAAPSVFTCATGGPGFSDCGPDGGSNCCESIVVPGGSYTRQWVALLLDDAGPGLGPGDAPGSVSTFRLDKYEVTIGRYRQFSAAVAGGWRPAAGSGKHTHLNGGLGLVKAPWNDAGPSNEDGWDVSWNGFVATAKNIPGFGEDPNPYIWTPAAGAHEAWPMASMSWYEAYAFCVWDGGFLPSWNELDYTAAGGSEGRIYPWSTPADSVLDCDHANYSGGGDAGVNHACRATTTRVGTFSPAGDGKWGHADLSGNVSEWTLDAWHSEIDLNAGSLGLVGVRIYQCMNDCADFQATGTKRVILHGGAYEGPDLDCLAGHTGTYGNAHLMSRNPYEQWPRTGGEMIGFRCARTP